MLSPALLVLETSSVALFGSFVTHESVTITQACAHCEWLRNMHVGSERRVHLSNKINPRTNHIHKIVAFIHGNLKLQLAV